ncbi:hypothetical protein [Bacillus tuaregi]|uniref:hypothetical protein n=1 Tax=Bacillus tuaregi TaxID=1816695 RepID=UPI0008F8BBFE|nr:hypothetical protein [Bacillus tuaregi]
MKYEYHMYSLESWLKENKQSRLSIKDDHLTTDYVGKLERLENEFNQLAVEEFDQWAESKTRKIKRYIPYLYKKDLDEQRKSKLLHFIHHQVEKDHRYFRVTVDVLYQSLDTDNLWPIVKKAYQLNKPQVSRRMEEEQAKKWQVFTREENPILFLAKAAANSALSFIEELKTFFLTENLPFFQSVFLEGLKGADEAFFIREKALFKSFFVSSSIIEQQQMAESLIQRCKLNHVKPLGLLVYEKLKIYRRKPMLWKHVGEEEKKRFAKWVLTLEIKEFFDQVNKNHERFQYWKKFIVKLEDAVVIDKKKTLILYFEDVVIMEVLATGAVYVYEMSVFNRHFQHKVDKLLDDREKPRRVLEKEPDLSREDVRDQDLVYQYGRLSHHRGWQHVFDHWLKSNLGWEVEADVLQKEADRDEGYYDTFD